MAQVPFLPLGALRLCGVWIAASQGVSRSGMLRLVFLFCGGDA